MADLQEFYKNARKKGIIDQSVDYASFEQAMRDERQRQDFYQYATNEGLRIGTPERFGEYVSTHLPQSAPQEAGGVSVPQHIDSLDDERSRAFGQMSDPLYSGQYQYHQQVADKEAQMQREEQAQLPITERDRQLQEQIRQKEIEGKWGKPNGTTFGVDSQTGMPTITKTEGNGAHLYAGEQLANQDEINELKGQLPSYLTREVKTPEDLLVNTAEAWSSNTEMGRDFKDMLDAGTITPEEYKQAMIDANEDYINQQTRILGQKATNATISDISKTINPIIEQLKAERHKAMQRAAGQGQMRGGTYGAIGAQMSANTAYDMKKDAVLSEYLQAQQYLVDAIKISEAAQKGQGFWKGLGGSLGDVDTWDMGMSQLVRSANLKKIVEKYEKKPDSLTDSEKALMDAAVAYMSACAYNSDKLSRLYKAGQTTGESLPFMLQFAVMPIGAIKDKVAKGILGYGIEQFGGKALQTAGKYTFGRAAAETGTALLGNVAAAGVQTAAFGAPKIAEGTISRMTGDIKPEFDENGRIVYGGRENQQGLGEALWNAGVDTYVENLSEMILTSGDPIKAWVGGTNLFKNLSKNETIQVLAKMGDKWSGSTMGKIAGQMQFRGYPEEVAEEYVGNLLRWGMSTDVHSAAEAGLDADSQIDLWMGLAPTSIAFAGLGLGEYSVRGGIDRFQSSQAARKLRNIMLEGEERKYLDNLLKSRDSDEFKFAAHDIVKSILRNDKLSAQEKRAYLDNLYVTYQSQLALEAEDAKIADEVKTEVQGITNKNNGYVYPVSLAGDPDTQGHIVAGYVEIDETDPSKPRIGNDEIVTVKLNDGRVVQLNTKELDLTGTPQMAQEVFNARAEERINTQRIIDQSKNIFHQGDVATIQVPNEQTGETDEFASNIVSVSDEGVEVEVTDPTGQVSTTVIPHDVALQTLAVVKPNSKQETPEKKTPLAEQQTTGTQQTQSQGQTAVNMPTFVNGDESISVVDNQNGTYTNSTTGEIVTREQMADKGYAFINPQPTSVSQAPVEQAPEVQQPEVQEPAAPVVPNIETMSAADYAGAAVEYMGDRASAMAYLEAERDKADAEVQRTSKLKVTRFNGPEDFKRQNDQIQAAKSAAIDRYNKLQNAITAANAYKTLAEQKEEAERKAREAAMREQRRQLAEAEAAGDIEARWQNTKKTVGFAATKTLPNGQKVNGHYILTEAGDVVPSHDPRKNYADSEGYVMENGQNVNDNNYKDPDVQRIALDIAQKYGGQAVEQMPFLENRAGRVLSGNNRTISGIIAAENNTDQAYLAALAENAQQYGFTPEQLAEYEHPRLQFVVEDELPFTTATFAMFNQQEKKTKSSVNRAVANSKMVTEAVRDKMLEIMDQYESLDSFFGSESAASDIVQALITEGLMTQQEVAGLTENTGSGFKFGQSGREYVTDMLLGTLFDEQTIKMLAGEKTLKQAILRALPSIVANRRLKGYELTDSINNAIQLLYEARKANEGNSTADAFQLYLRQIDAFKGSVMDRYNGFDIILANRMSAGVEQLREILGLYNNSAMNEANGQMGFFEPRTIDDIKQDVYEYYTNQQPELAAALNGAAATGAQPQSAVPSGVANEGKTRPEVKNPQENLQESEKSSTFALSNGQSVSKAEYQQQLGDYLQTIKDIDHEPYLCDNSTLLDAMAVVGAKPGDIARAQYILGVGGHIDGFYLNSYVILNVDELPDFEKARSKYVHERQHDLTRKNIHRVQEVMKAASEQELKDLLFAYTGHHIYDMNSYAAVADEFISFSMEEAYKVDTDEELEDALKGFGVKDELINIIKSINDEQRGNQSFALARRNAPVYQSSQNSGAKSGGNSKASSQGNIRQTGSNSYQPSLRGTERGGSDVSESGQVTPFEKTRLGLVAAEFRRQHPDAAVGVLFREKDSYEFYDKDAVRAAEILGLQTTEKDGVPFLSFPLEKLQDYLGKLVRGGMKIGITRKPDHKPTKGDYQIGDSFTYDGKTATIQDFTYFGTAILDVDGRRVEVSKEQLDDILESPTENRETSETKASGANAAEIEIGGALVDRLGDMGLNVSTDLAANRQALKEAKADKSEAGTIHYFKTPSGQQYGFSYKGKVYLDPTKIDAELPIHEYGHLWAEALRRLNPENWQRVVETIKADKEAWEFVKSLRPELTDENEIAEEVIATFSGKNGAEKMRAEYERMHGKDADYKSKWGNIFKNISKAIQDFWKAVGDFLNIRYESAEQVYDQVLKDFVDNMNPWKRVSDFLRHRDAEYVQAAESGDIKTATNLFYDALKENIGNGITPYMSVGTYNNLKRLAKGVKTRDAALIKEAADLIAPLIPDNAVLIPAPSHDGRATDMLDLAKAIAEVTGSEVADVLRSAPRESQYQAKKTTGVPMASKQLGIAVEGEIPADKTPIIIDNVVDSGNTAEACIQALGKGVVVTLADSAEQYRHAASLRSAAPILRDKDGNIVPLTKRFNLNGSRYLGRRMYLRPNDPRFAISGTQVIPVGDKTLVGLHNISAEKLRKAIKMGGLANPSTAVINIASQNHEQYGDISLIMPSSLVDSKTGRNAGTFTGDIWSPTYPSVERIMSDKGDEAYYQAITKAFGDNEARRPILSRAKLDFDDYLDRGNIRAGLAYWYLLEKGIEPGDVYYNSGISEDVKKRFEPLSGYFSNLSAEEREILLSIIADEKGTTVEQMKQDAQEAKARYQQTIDDPNEKQFRKNIAQKAIDEIDYYGVQYGILSNEYHRLNNAVKNDGTIDLDATLIAAQDIVQTQYQSDFERWLSDMDKRFDIKEVLFDGYNAEGDRIYKPHTLANASRMMNQEPLQNAGGNGGLSATRGQLVERMETLADIRLHKDRLRPGAEEDVETEEWNKMSDEWFAKILNPLSDMQKISDNPFSNVGYAESRLQEALTKSNPVAYLNKEYGYKIDPNGEWAKNLRDMVQRVKDLPTKYFETKFRRPVYLDEFANAVVPVGLPQDLRDGLTGAGMTLFEYDPAEQGSRRAATLKATADEGIRFAISGNTRTRYAEEMESIKNEAVNNGTFMQAPNGKPTNLTERQWLQVRLRSFKRWFGDWENDPEDSSKVLDVNGEPMVAKHGTPFTFTTFDKSKQQQHDAGWLGRGFYFFTKNDDYAAGYAQGGRVLNTFLNIREPYFATNEDMERLSELEDREESARFTQQLIDDGYDGVYYDGDLNGEYVAFEPNQIKSATDNDGSFSEENDNILFSISNARNDIFYSNAERAVEGIKQDKATPEQWRAMIEKAGGLKAGEDKWIGLSDWLSQQRPTIESHPDETPLQFAQRAQAERKKFTVSKQDILDYIRQNKIQIEEVEYGDTMEQDAFRTLAEEYREVWDELRRKGDLTPDELDAAAMEEMNERHGGDDFSFAFNGYRGVLEVANEDAAGYYLDVNPINDTRLQYTTEGLTNKHEIAMTVPTIEAWNETDEIHFGDAGEGKVIAWARFGDAKTISKPEELVQAEQEYKEFSRKMIGQYGLTYTERVMSDSERQQESDLIAKLNQARKDHPQVEEKVLVIDEIQSKRHQEGREFGYVDSETAIKYRQLEKEVSKAQLEYHNYRERLWKKYENQVRTRGEMLDILTPEEKSKHTELQEKYENLYDRWEEFKKNIPVSAIPAAPFEKNWHELAMKRILRFAAENGYDKVAWTTGDQQARRYDLSKVIDSIELEHVGNNGRKMFRLKGLDYKIITEPDGKIYAGQEEFVGKNLSDVVGKDVAKRMLEMNEGDIMEGNDLRIGGEGMRGFYDDILPRFMQKYGKKWGVQVGEVTMPQLEEGYQTMHAIDINDAMRESVMEGQPMFSISGRSVNGTMKPQEGETRSQYIARVAETVKNMTPRNTTIDDAIRFSITVNHNSPYLLKRADGSFVDPETGERLGFDHRFMGKGEGGQAHGWGSYFSVNDIREYAERGGIVNDVYYKGKHFDYLSNWDEEDFPAEAARVMAWFTTSGFTNGIDVSTKQGMYDALDNAIRYYRRRLEDPQDRAMNGSTFEKTIDVIKELHVLVDQYGDDIMVVRAEKHHYVAEIPDNDGTNYLDEMKTLPKPLRRKIAAAVRELPGEPMPSVKYVNYTGGWRQLADMIERNQWAYLEIRDRLFNAFGGYPIDSEKRLSKLMSSLGFVGVHYDGRRDGECYVIFDENDAIITDHIRFAISGSGNYQSRNSIVTEALVKQANDSFRLMQSALRKVSADLRTINAIRTQQFEYDRKVVDMLLDLYNSLLQENSVWAGYMPDTTRRIATQIVHAIGKKDISAEVNTIMDHMVHAQAKAAQRQWDKLRTTPVDKINISGVVMQGKVALQGQHALKAMNEALDSKATIEQLEDQIAQLMDMEDNATDESLKLQYKGQWIGYTIAAQHLERIQHLVDERNQLDIELQAARSNRAIKPSARQQLVANIQQAMRDNYIAQADAYAQSAKDLAEYVTTQEEQAKDFIHRQDANRDKIRSYAQRDLEGLATNPNRNRTRGNIARQIWDAFASPIRDLQSLLRLTGLHAPDGEGYLYNHFMRGWMDGADKERLGIVNASKTLDAKISELTHGKYKTWEEAARKINDASHNMFTITMLNGVDGKDMPVTEDIPLSAGNALYIYAVNKMNDGRMKLAGMNITEDDVKALTDKVREQFGQEILDVVDWVQSEYFSQLRNRYNPTHEALFGAPMDAIENYFPLRINAAARQQNEDLSEPDTDAARLLAGTSTGAIKRRTKNSLPLDVRNADFFQEVIRHIAQMERWNAFAQWNRDANILFSDINFRNRIKGMNGTIYGSGNQLYNYMKDAFRVAIGTYKPKTDQPSEITLNIAKGVTSAKINFRVWTALKQIASFPAFFTYMTDGVFVGSYLRNWMTPHGTMKWARENLPNFEKRVSKRDMGDMRLMQRTTDWQWNKRVLEWSQKYGMAANVYFDTLTCATGARAVYDSRLAEYLKKGYPQEQAEQRARQDAEQAFNTSQQSSEGAFMSPVQMDRNVYTAALTVFRTSPIQYTRNFFYHTRNLLRKFGRGSKEEQIAFRMGQYKNDGLTDEQARKAAEKDYNKSIRSDIAGFVVYGALLNILWRLVGYVPYLLFGDDDDKKKQILDEATSGGAWFSPFTGLMGGGVIESALDGNGSVADMFAPELPFTQDVKRVGKYLDNDKYAEFANQALSVAMQSTTGFDPQTAGDMIQRIVTTIDSEEELSAAEQALRISQALLSIPQSQYEQQLVDRVVADDSEYDAALADYIRYQKVHTAPLTWWLRGEESDEKAEEDAEKRFDRLLNERDELHNPEEE